jgi:hypothetical protein
MPMAIISERAKNYSSRKRLKEILISRKQECELRGMGP